MTSERLERMQDQLIKRFRLDCTDDDFEDVCMLLGDSILDAEAELLLYLNREELPETMFAKVVALAAVYAQQAMAEEPGLRSASYSEGDVSQNETYLTGVDFQVEADAILKSVAHWRLRAKG